MNKSIAVLGCGKDVARYLPTTMQTIKNVTNMFADYRVFIYENDSKDITEQLLVNYRKQDRKIIIKCEKWITTKYPKVTWRIAYAREQLKSMLIKSNFIPDYVLIMDLDDVANNVENGKNFVYNALNLEEYWDGIFPHLTYDFWAFRTKRIKYNYWEVLRHFRKYFPNFDIKKYLAGFKDDLVPDENKLCAVTSSFNGIALYKYNIYIKGTYSGVNNFFTIIPDVNLRSKIQPEECEHVNFHRSLGPNAKLKILHGFIYV